MEGRLHLRGVPRRLGHVHHQRRGQRAQTVPDQPRRQPAAGDRVAGGIWWVDCVWLYRFVYRADIAGGGVQPVDGLECEPGAGSPGRQGGLAPIHMGALQQPGTCCGPLVFCGERACPALGGEAAPIASSRCARYTEVVGVGASAQPCGGLAL